MSDTPDRLVRIEELFEASPEGVHQLGEPASLDAAMELPVALGAFYLQHDGAHLFHETLQLVPIAELERADGRWRVGLVDGDEIYVDRFDAVWRLEADTGEWLHEGTRFDRWLEGWLEGEAVLYDADGEFLEFVIEESGEALTPAAELERARRAHKRDRGAAGPHWRLARALLRSDKLDAARDELEQLVARHPGLAGAWFDLARISEQKGELAGAVDEAVAAAEAAPDSEHAPYFLASAARLARAAGDEARRAELAQRALALDADLARSQRQGAESCLQDGDVDGARQLLAVALALAPNDLEALALQKRVSSEA